MDTSAIVNSIVNSIVKAKTVSMYLDNMLDDYSERDISTLTPPGTADKDYVNENRYLQWSNMMKAVYNNKKQVDYNINNFIVNHLMKHSNVDVYGNILELVEKMYNDKTNIYREGYNALEEQDKAGNIRYDFEKVMAFLAGLMKEADSAWNVFAHRYCHLY